MKIKVEYSESIQVSEGLWRKWDLSVEVDEQVDGHFPEYPNVPESIKNNSQHLKDQIEEHVKRWHKEAQPQTSSDLSFPRTVGGLSNYITPSPSIIDRSIERLEILIDDCKTKSDLYRIEDEYGAKIHSTQSLSTLFKSKLEELSK